jgi:hypothetical protein
LKSILDLWKIDSVEYKKLDDAFGQLCYYAAWQLSRKNTKNNHQNDLEDFYQELVFSLLIAGSYTKRQAYIESSLAACAKHTKDPFCKQILENLQNLWNNRTRHGANRQKYGPKQEKILDNLVEKVVPLEERPDRNRPLEIDAKFYRYCKQIVWNRQRSLGKKITREKPLRVGQVSLSSFDYLQGGL